MAAQRLSTICVDVKPFECNQLAVSRATQLVARGQQELTVDDIVDTGLVARGQHRLTVEEEEKCLFNKNQNI